MSDEEDHETPSDAPPADANPEHGRAEPAVGRESARERAKERVRARLESVIPEILKRAVELGVEKARESPDNFKQFVHDLKVPKDVAHYLFQQVDETKSGLFRVVAKELRDFLEQTNFSGEIQKLLTTVQFEVNTTIRFTPNDGRPRKTENAEDETAGPDESEGRAGTSSAPKEGSMDPEPQDSEPPSRRPLPKAEIKTAVNVRRDKGERDPKRRGV
jgi:hypothetical protein